jgi:hypothetical protein
MSAIFVEEHKEYNVTPAIVAWRRAYRAALAAKAPGPLIAAVLWPRAYDADMMAGIQLADPTVRLELHRSVVLLRDWAESQLTSQPPAPPPAMCSHSLDFTSVVWFRVPYEFAKGLQADAVRVLWKAWEQGGHSLSEQTIGEMAGSGNDRFRLYHVFAPMNKKTRKREAHTAWGIMIRSAGKGKFHLVPPDDAVITR